MPLTTINDSEKAFFRWYTSLCRTHGMSASLFFYARRIKNQRHGDILIAKRNMASTPGMAESDLDKYGENEVHSGVCVGAAVYFLIKGCNFFRYREAVSYEKSAADKIIEVQEKSAEVDTRPKVKSFYEKALISMIADDEGRIDHAHVAMMVGEYVKEQFKISAILRFKALGVLVDIILRYPNHAFFIGMWSKSTLKGHAVVMLNTPGYTALFDPAYGYCGKLKKNTAEVAIAFTGFLQDMFSRDALCTIAVFEPLPGTEFQTWGAFYSDMVGLPGDGKLAVNN